MLQDELEKRREVLEHYIEAVSHNFRPTKDRIRISYSKGHMQYSLAVPGEKHGTYLKRDQFNIVKDVCQREYDGRFLNEADIQLRAINRAIQAINQHDIRTVYDGLNEWRQKIVTPAIVPDDLYRKNWLEEEYETLGFAPDAPAYEDGAGHMFRSKSELIIAGIIDEMGIPYKYEAPTHIKGYGRVYTDFTLLKMLDRSEVKLEHYGLLSDPEYVRKACLKTNGYIQSGWIPGKNLIITYEADGAPLNVKSVRAMIETVIFH